MNNCRFCNHELTHVFCDLGHQPPSNSFISESGLLEPEIHYPLKAWVCENCWLVQMPEFKPAAEIFSEEYVYLSSTSPSWVEHARKYVEMVTARLGLKVGSRVLEIGSNDGYLLQWFDKKIDAFGCDPSKIAVEKAGERGIHSWLGFFDTLSIVMYPFFWKKKFDLVCGINVLAHQPDINDFCRAMKMVLAPEGTITMEFPSLERLVDGCLFDTIYHEHYSYFSMTSLNTIFWANGLEIYDVEELDTHGGSFRIWARHPPPNTGPWECKVPYEIANREYRKGVTRLSYYEDFQPRVDAVKRELMRWFASLPCDKLVLGYGAAAKANTLLNYCGISKDLLPAVCDKSEAKVGKFMPGSHIPVIGIEEFRKYRPDYVLILAWNLKEEIMNELAFIRDWGGKFVVAMPRLEVVG